MRRGGQCPERNAKTTHEVVYSILLVAYPRDRREADGEVMLDANRVRYELARARGGWALVDFWVRLVLWDIIKDASSERLAQGKERMLGDGRALLALGGAAAFFCGLLLIVAPTLGYAMNEVDFAADPPRSQIGVYFTGPMLPRWVEHPSLDVILASVGWTVLCGLTRGWWRPIAAAGLTMIVFAMAWEVYRAGQIVDPIDMFLWPDRSYQLPLTGTTLSASDLDSAASWATFVGALVLAVAVARSSTLSGWSALPLLLAASQYPHGWSFALWNLDYLADHVTFASYWWYAHLAKLVRYGPDIAVGFAWLVLGLALLQRRISGIGWELPKVRS